MIKGGEGQEGRRRMGEERGGWPERGRRKIKSNNKLIVIEDDDSIKVLIVSEGK